VRNDVIPFDGLAKLLEYPGEDYARTAQELQQALGPAHPEAASCLEGFARAIRGKSVERLQEFFVQTFDLNPVCALEVGWHLFGEAYERGAFLVKMRQELRRHEIAESSEMPDHLGHVLPLLARMKSEEAREFAQAFVLPALDKMLPGLEGAKNPYEGVLKAARSVVAARYVSVSEEVVHD